MKIFLFIIISVTLIFLLLTKGIFCATEGGKVVSGFMLTNGCCKSMKTIKPIGGNNPKQYSIGNKCYIAGSTVMYSSKSHKKNSMICSYCGNNKCDTYENICNCPQDCKNGQNSEYASFDTFCEKISSDAMEKCGSYFSSDFKKSLFSSSEILPIECLCQENNVEKYNFFETCSTTTDNLCWYKAQ